MGSVQQDSSVSEHEAEYRDVIELIRQYRKQEGEQNPIPDVQPGFLIQHLPDQPPHDPEPWDKILNDVKQVIMKGVVKRASPYNFGHVAITGSKPATLASMMQETVMGLTLMWSGCPSGVELEMVVMDWMAKSLGLPHHFLHDSTGGGVIIYVALISGQIGYGPTTISFAKETSSSEGELMSMCAARNKKIREVLATDSALTPHDVFPKLVVYSSQEAHPNADRACQLLMLRHHVVAVDKADNLSMTGSKLQQAMDRDKEKGLIPFFVIATLGTTSTCAFDNLAEIGPICAESACWLHVDAAYAGAAFLCPEFRHYLHGVEHVDSFCVNFYKWMKLGIGCSGFWLKNSSYLTNEFGVRNNTAKYLEEPTAASTIPVFYKWQLHTCKPFNSLQLWFVIRMYGISGLQDSIRNDVALARYAAYLLSKDNRFAITHPPAMGLVCFKLKNQPDHVNREYLECIQKDRRLYLIGSSDCDGFFLRLCVFAEKISHEEIDASIGILRELADRVPQGANEVVKASRLL